MQGILPSNSSRHPGLAVWSVVTLHLPPVGQTPLPPPRADLWTRYTGPIFLGRTEDPGMVWSTCLSTAWAASTQTKPLIKSKLPWPHGRRVSTTIAPSEQRALLQRSGLFLFHASPHLTMRLASNI